MTTSSLDNRVLCFFVAGMLALFCSMAFEANRNGMTDPVVAVRDVPNPTVASAMAAAETPALMAQTTVHKTR